MQNVVTNVIIYLLTVCPGSGCASCKKSAQETDDVKCDTCETGYIKNDDTGLCDGL